MRVPKRDVTLLAGFIGILMTACSYLSVYQPAMEKAETLRRENLKLQAQIDDLDAKMDKKDSYMADTENMRREIEAVYQRFPVDVREEDSIRLAIDQEMASSMMISSINIGACEPVVLPDDTESVLMNRNVTVNYLVSYEGLKRSIKNIGSQNNRMSIDSLTVSYDESTGLLTGVTSINMYCIPGQEGKEYVPPDFSSVLAGTSNIFSSIEYGREDVSEDMEERDEEEGQ